MPSPGRNTLASLCAPAICALIALSGATDAAGGTVVTGLQNPVAFARHPGDPAVWFVVQQNGIIWVIRSGVRQPTPFINLAGTIIGGGERGLLGLAFPSDYSSSGRFFVSFTAAAATGYPEGSTVVRRYRRSTSNPDVADTSSWLDMRWSTGLRYIQQPFANHNGGCIAFGPDGYMYVARGDGGAGGDPGNRAQNPNELLGKILRIDVNVPDSNPDGFVVPADNPFLDGSPIAARPEIWSFGLRNPWKFTFDDPALGGTGAMLIADVGQGAREEVNFEPAGQGGRNYGWPNQEGAIPYDATRPVAFLPLVGPIHDYGRSSGASVTGGYVYRGSRMPSMRGRYYFADFISGRVWSFLISGQGTAQNLVEHTAELGGSAVLGNISGFGEDAAGELVILNYSAGTIVAIHLTTPTGLRVIP